MSSGENEVQILGTVSTESDEIVLLNHEMKLLCDNVNDDVMYVFSYGLGMERLFLNDLLVHSTPDMVTLVLNVSEVDVHYLLTELRNLKPEFPPRSVIGTSKREKVYNTGGVIFMTAQQLISDILNEVIDYSNIGCIMVYECSTIGKSDNLVHSIHVIKAKNSKVHVKAYTSNVRAICYHPTLTSLQSFYDSLKLKKVEFVCRFNEEVVQSIEIPKLKITSYQYKLSSKISKIYDNVVEQIIREYNDLLKIAVQTYGFEKREDDGALYCMYRRSFFEIQLMEKSASIEGKHLEQLKNLRKMREVLRSIVNYDVISLYDLLESFGKSDDIGTNVIYEEAIWEYRKEFKDMKQEVFNIATKRDSNNDSICEIPKKWKIIEDLLSQIKETINSRPGHVLFICDNEDTCCRIQLLIEKGKKALLKHISSLSKNLFSEEDVNETANIEENPMWEVERIKLFDHEYFYSQEKKEDYYGALLNPQKRGAQDVIETHESSQKKIKSNSETSINVFEANLLITAVTDKYTIAKILSTYQPRFIISLSPNLSITRTIEMYNAIMSKEFKKTVEYFSIANVEYELEHYGANVHRESFCFQRLIRQLSSVAPSRDGDGAFIFDEDQKSLRVARLKPIHANITIDKFQEIPTVIVDSREFASELPFELSKLGIKLVTATLEVGDYILSPDTCLERKAIDDLTISLMEGRIFKQCEGMFRYYKKVILLIESSEKFEAKRKGANPFKGDLSRHSLEVKKKFCVLLRLYPKLTVLWFTSPSKAAVYLKDIKMGMLNADLNEVLSYKTGLLINPNESVVDDTHDNVAYVMKPEMQRIFSKIPFLCSGDSTKIMNNPNIPDFKTLANLKEEGIQKCLENNQTAAKELYAMLNTDFRKHSF
uniref:DNA repair endonuclease XPF n=1 Tax=Parastrongyloides trichosuri TaxID=131310 RepID=A0A0N4Z0X6_PARTI